MMQLKIPQVLTVLSQNMNDDRRMQQADIDKREDFSYDDKVYLADYCVYLVQTYTEYDKLNYKSDQYTWAEEFRFFNRWLIKVMLLRNNFLAICTKMVTVFRRIGQKPHVGTAWLPNKETGWRKSCLV